MLAFLDNKWVSVKITEYFSKIRSLFKDLAKNLYNNLSNSEFTFSSFSAKVKLSVGFFLLMLLVLIVVLILSRDTYQVKSLNIEPPKIRQVKFFYPTIEKSKSIIQADGTIEPKHRIKIKSGTNGKVKTINPGNGGFVRQGDILVELEKTEAVAKLDIAKLHLQIETQLYERIKKLYDQGAVSEQALKRAETDVDIRRAEYVLASDILDKKTISAPIDGYLSTWQASEHQVVSEGYELNELFNFSEVFVIYWVKEELFNKLKLGQKLKVCARTVEDRASDATCAEGELIFIAPEARRDDNYLMLAGFLGNKDRLFVPGMDAAVKHYLDEEKIKLYVPENNIISEVDGYKIMIIDNANKVRKVKVKIAERGGNKVRVLSGLTAQDRIVERGNFILLEGELVNAVS